MILQVEAGVAVGVPDRFPDVRRLVGAHSRAPHPRVQQPGDEQGIVADLLGIEPEPRATGIQPIRRVAGQRLGQHLRTLAEGRRGQQQPHQRLHVPPRIAMVNRQPVEQFGMTGGHSPQPKIGACQHQPRPEELLPQAIHGDPRRQRLVGPEQPFRQVQPAGPLVPLLELQRREDGGDPGFDLLARLVVLPPQHHEGVAGLVEIAKDEGARQALFQGHSLRRGQVEPVARQPPTGGRRPRNVRLPVGLQRLAQRGGHFGHRPSLQQGRQFGRDAGRVDSLAVGPPRAERRSGIAGRGQLARDQQPIPIDCSAKLAKHQPADRFAPVQLPRFPRHLEGHPLSTTRHIAHPQSIGIARGPRAHSVCVPPDRPPHPLVGLQLKPQCLGWATPAHPHLDLEPRLPGDHQRRRKGLGFVGVISGERLPQRSHARRHPRPRLCHPGGRVARRTADPGSRGKLVVEPDVGDRHWLGRGQLLGRREVRLGRVGQCHPAECLGQRLSGLLLGGFQDVQVPLLRGGGQPQEGFGRVDVPIHRRVGGTVEERVQRVELTRAERVVLVVVADRTPPRQPQPSLHHRARAVDCIPEQEFGLD